MELNATAKVILGLLAMRPRSGYEIKSFVDDSTRYFWPASYGQIYPELRRLAEAGLVEGTDSPTGGRQRTIFELTKAGRAALRQWHSQPAEHFDYRDEGLLKLFFRAVAPGRAADIARERAEEAAEVADELRRSGRPEGKDQPDAVLRFGIEQHLHAEWFERRLAFDQAFAARLPVPTTRRS
jgi:DNA-binding PadR family transcriptional regulator